MKITSSLRERFDSQVDVQNLVEDRVKSTLQPRVPETWHYEGRVKSIESYAQKIETGQFDPGDLEDFFACTLVVPTMGFIDEAERLVGELFEIVSRKPETNRMAMAGALDFRFDHIRIYARRRVPAGLEEGPIHRIRFEIQIKTYLQHAWSIATHDLTYKTNELSWGKERVAAQVKATLEASEIAIVEAERLAKSGNRLLTREDSDTTELVTIVGTLQRHFTENQMPVDVKRLAATLRGLLRGCKLTPAALDGLLHKGKLKRGGSHPTDLSPYSVVFLYLASEQPAKLLGALKRRGGPVFFVPGEVKLPDSFGGVTLHSARRLD